MLVELVQVATDDGVRLDGAWHVPSTESGEAPGKGDAPVDAWLLVHGTGGSFYSGSLLASLARRLAATGAAILRANTRGHDLVWSGGAGSRRYLGAAFERVDDCRRDLRAWCDFLVARGCRRLGIVGHSLGAIKAIYAQAEGALPAISLMVAVSPPRLSHSFFLASSRGQEFAAAFRAAEEHVAAGRNDALMDVSFPMPYMVSAAAYLDRYGAQERYNVLRLIDRVSCPMLLVYGSSELAEVPFAEMPQDAESLRTVENRLQVAIVAGADHAYTACHDSLAARIESWLRKTVAP